MIACKMAVICPERILTMVLLAATGGGWDAIPMSLNALSIIAHGCFDKTLFGKARLETELIYSQKRLGQNILDKCTVRDIMIEKRFQRLCRCKEPVDYSVGERGQLYAIWNHKLTEKELVDIRNSKILVKLLHGKYDILANPRRGINLARRLYAPIIMVDGGHLVIHENAKQVGKEILKIITL